MKVFITGVAGTGKSTIAKALTERGITTVDFSDYPALRYWRNKITKKKSDYSPNNDMSWFDDHECVCDLDELKKLFVQHENLVITGVATGTEALGFFDKIILLQSSPETIRQRMETRNRVFGKKKEEQDSVIAWRDEFDPMILSHEAIPISTEGALEEVVEKILTEISKIDGRVVSG